MFEVKKYTGRWYIIDERGFSLHRNGDSFYSCPEWFPIQELAQAVLDKYWPSHVWEHGDVFYNNDSLYCKIYIKIYDQQPQIFHLHET